MNDTILFHLKDVFARVEAGRENEQVHLKCIVLNRRKKGKLIFFDVHDDSESTQIIVRKETANSSTWETSLNIVAGDAIEFSGVTSVQYLSNRRDLGDLTPSCRNSVTIIVEKLSRVQEGNPVADRGRRVVGLSSPITQVYLARLKKWIVSCLAEHESLVEIDTRLISSTRPRSGGVYPLQIHYDGYGAPFYVVPSPIPQLLQLLTSTRIEGAYCVSRCFTQGYRDPIVSVESLIIAIAWRGKRTDELLSLADHILRRLIKEEKSVSSMRSDFSATKTRRRGSLSDAGGAAVLNPEIQIFSPSPPSSAAYEVGRLCWPRIAAKESDFREYVIAEGHSAGSF